MSDFKVFSGILLSILLCLGVCNLSIELMKVKGFIGLEKTKAMTGLDDLDLFRIQSGKIIEEDYYYQHTILSVKGVLGGQEFSSFGEELGIASINNKPDCPDGLEFTRNSLGFNYSLSKQQASHYSKNVTESCTAKAIKILYKAYEDRLKIYKEKQQKENMVQINNASNRNSWGL